MGTKYSQRGNKVFPTWEQSVCSLQTLIEQNRDVTDVASLFIYDAVFLPMSSGNHETADGDKDDEKG